MGTTCESEQRYGRLEAGGRTGELDGIDGTRGEITQAKLSSAWPVLVIGRDGAAYRGTTSGGRARMHPTSRVVMGEGPRFLPPSLEGNTVACLGGGGGWASARVARGRWTSSGERGWCQPGLGGGVGERLLGRLVTLVGKGRRRRSRRRPVARKKGLSAVEDAAVDATMRL